ncbi:MAG: transcription factor [Desulfurococcales archaeon]|nr:transcription factor [Desulfurococcales archaeon]
MASELIDQVADLIEAMYGKKARQLFEYLVSKGSVVPEEYIGKELGFKSNEARRLLQYLAEEGIISFRRVASRDKSLQGWYINIDNLEGILIARLRKALEKLKTRREYEDQTNIYFCPIDGIKFSLEEAISNDFTCPRCGSVLEEYDGSRAVRFLDKKIKEIRDALIKIGVL